RRLRDQLAHVAHGALPRRGAGTNEVRAGLEHDSHAGEGLAGVVESHDAPPRPGIDDAHAIAVDPLEDDVMMKAPVQHRSALEEAKVLDSGDLHPPGPEAVKAR